MTDYGITPAARVIRLGDWREQASYTHDLWRQYVTFCTFLGCNTDLDGGHRRDGRALTGGQLARTWPAWQRQR